MAGVSYMRKKSSFFQKIGALGINQKGLSLVEMMVVVTIMSLVGVGVSSLLTNMISIQKKVEKKDSILQFKNALEANIKDNTSWAFSVYHATNAATLNCLRDDVGGCVDLTTFNNFNVFNRAGAIIFQGASATGGFTYAGISCNTFDAAAGNDACPLRYNLSWTVRCPGGVNPCNKPIVHVQGLLVNNPQNKSDTSNNIDVGAYTLDFNRGDLMRYEPLEVRHIQYDGSAPGACNVGGLATRALGNLNYDVGGNISGTTATTFTLIAGTYFCTVTAQVYHQPTGFKIQLNGGGGNIHQIANGFTAPYTSQTVSGTIGLQLNADTAFTVEQYCPAGTPTDAPAANFQLGIPAPDYAIGNTFTRVSCVRSL